MRVEILPQAKYNPLPLVGATRDTLVFKGSKELPGEPSAARAGVRGAEPPKGESER